MSYDPTSVLSSSTVFLGSTTPFQIQTGPGALYGLEIGNSDTLGCFVKCFDVAVGSFTIGTSTPFVNEYVASQSNLVLNWASHPKNFVNACLAVVTQGIAGTDTVAPNANKVSLNAGYR